MRPIFTPQFLFVSVRNFRKVLFFLGLNSETGTELVQKMSFLFFVCCGEEMLPFLTRLCFFCCPSGSPSPHFLFSLIINILSCGKRKVFQISSHSLCEKNFIGTHSHYTLHKKRNGTRKKQSALSYFSFSKEITKNSG